MNRHKMVEALLHVRAGEPIHPNTAKALIRQQLVRETASGLKLLEAGLALLGVKFVIQQSKKLRDDLLHWVNIGDPFDTLEAAESDARLRSVADEVNYRVVPDGANPEMYTLYAFGIRYIENVDGMRTLQTQIVRPTGDEGDPLYLFAVERNQGTGWQRIGDRLYTSNDEAESAAVTASKAKPGDYRVVPDDAPALPPVMWRAGHRCPNVHLLREMAVIGGGLDLIQPLVQLWTGETS